jgi:hypothetical protein
VLSEVLGREVGLGKIIHGDDHSTLKVKTLALARKVQLLTGKITTLLSDNSPPDLILNRHCAECEFKNRCTKRSAGSDFYDLTILVDLLSKSDAITYHPLFASGYSERLRRAIKPNP